MGTVEKENEIIISREEYEKYNRLKKYRRNAIEQFDVIKALMFRLNVFFNLLIEENNSYEEIIFNLQSAMDELSENCRDYEEFLKN